MTSENDSRVDEVFERVNLILLSLWAGTDPSPSVQLDLQIGRGSAVGGITFVSDEHGDELPDRRRLADGYNVHHSALPPPNIFRLHDLPPTLEPMRPGAPGTPVVETIDRPTVSAPSDHP